MTVIYLKCPMCEIALNLHVNKNWPMKYDLASTEKKERNLPYRYSVRNISSSSKEMNEKGIQVAIGLKKTLQTSLSP